ncbi:MAG: UDP-3-O-(3-hydroxymyristoyl)glucosamine N-acyltransferase, partial [Acidobacteria bacterium]|nr:UDP-3-O-(3-hydroxymyristoyl)glucosamine N-acyltransferase [Acidobacteriota bacterium]
MSAENRKTVSELAAHVGGRVYGDGGVLIERVASLTSAGESELAFVEDAKLLETALSCGASCLVVPEAAPELEGKCLIKVARPKLAFALIAEILHPPKREPPGIHKTAHIAASASLGEDIFVGAFVSIGERARVSSGVQLHHGACVGDDVTIGRDCVIHPNVTLYDGVTLGERVILHAG